MLHLTLVLNNNVVINRWVDSYNEADLVASLLGCTYYTIEEV